jgi:hypothetical protein
MKEKFIFCDEKTSVGDPEPMLEIRIRGLFGQWIRDPGWVKNHDPDQ